MPESAGPGMTLPADYTPPTRLWDRFQDKEYRDEFVAAHIATTVAAQIEHMREARGLTQTQLAEKAGMVQARISVLEDPSYDKQSLTTLKRLASALDVGLVVRFAPFSEVLAWALTVSPQRLSVQPFAEDYTPPTLEQRLDAAAAVIVKQKGSWIGTDVLRRMAVEVCRAFAPEHFKDTDTTTGKD
jgi:transcriptional regulator with XRE-family HTH domain